MKSDSARNWLQVMMQPKKTRKGIKLNLVLQWRETKLKCVKEGEKVCL